MSTTGLGGLTLRELENTFGVLFIGYIVAMVLYGFTFFQSYVYFSRYSKDMWPVKLLVGLLWAIDSTASALVSQFLYYYLVSLFPVPTTLVESTTTFCSENGLVIIAVYIVQLFYAIRIWQLSKNAWLTSTITAVSTAAFVFGIVKTVHMFQNKSLAHLAVPSVRIVVAICQGLTLVSAALISGAMLFYLRISRAVDPRLLEGWFDKLVAFTMSCGSGALVIQLLYFLIFVSSPTRLYWMPAHLVASKMFILSILTLLNSREVHRGQGFFEDKPSYQRRSMRAVLSSNSSRSQPSTGIPSDNKLPISIEVSQTIERHSSPKIAYQFEDDHSVLETDARSKDSLRSENS